MAAGKPLVEVALWLLVLRSGINAAFGSTNQETKGVVLCYERERQALLKFKHALNVTNDALPSWVGDNCSRWEGVRCNSETGHVIKLKLRDTINSDSGEIDSSLLELKHLRYLDLSGNNFGYKPIPKFFGSFLKLRYLNLSQSFFRGTVPWQIGNISGLRYLDLNGNSLNGTVPWQIGNISGLRYLDLHSNSLQIENLQRLSHLSSLKCLDMGYANLSMVSDWVRPINMIPSLSVLRLSHCDLRNFSTPLHLNLTSLTVLDLSYNSLTLKALDWFANFHSLVTLDLSNNRLEGPIPSSLWSHCNLLKLDLSFNNLNGDLNGFLISLTRCGPNNLEKHGRPASMRELYLSSNNFSGTVPESLGQLSNLVSLKMSYNSLEGAISEAHFTNLTRLEELDLSANSLFFNVSPHWIPPFQLQSIELSSCQLGPQFPPWLQFQRNLSYIDLSHSQISDVIPNWFWNLSSQVSFFNISQNLIRGKIPSSLNFDRWASVDFSSNRFEGPLPQYWSSINDLAYLDLSNNFLSGPIEIIDMSFGSLFSLVLSNNNLHGSIPSLICNVIYIELLDLSRNNLTGQIPSCFDDVQIPLILDLSYNNLDGPIPNILFSSKLMWLQLSHNNLSGVLPSSIVVHEYYWFLHALDLSGNRLSGSIPRWLGENASNLVILNLRSNMFHGNIPPQLSLLSSLQILDLANNKLSGEIPTSFGNFSSMAMTQNQIYSIVGENTFSYRECVTLIMKGAEMNYTSTLSLVTTMDLSRNSLSGEIPQELTSLHGLRNLNLSGNHLEGKIPKKIGSLKQLESLDLSQNRLSGKIPTSISSLTFLSKLNLSNNNLSGTIPLGNQLQTLLDPSIYAGNYDLCGPPLPKLCSLEVVPQPPNTFHGEDEKDGTEHWWFYVGVAPGFVAGFWLTCGILIFSKSWRIAYFRFFDRLNERLDGFYVKMVVTVKKKIQR